jgi:hypothetical protein
LEHIACIYNKGIGIAFAGFFKEGGEVGVSCGLAKYHLIVFPKQFVVGMDLAVYVGGL